MTREGTFIGEKETNYIYRKNTEEKRRNIRNRKDGTFVGKEREDTFVGSKELKRRAKTFVQKRRDEDEGADQWRTEEAMN